MAINSCNNAFYFSIIICIETMGKEGQKMAHRDGKRLYDYVLRAGKVNRRAAMAPPR
jgi:hypothetical protein